MKEEKVIPESRMTRTIIDFLINIPMFDRILSDELAVIAKHMNFIEVKKNETLFKEGDKGDYVCFIVNGLLEVIKKSGTGKRVVIAKLSRGRTIGEMSIIDNTPRSATIRACQHSTLVTLSKKSFDLILEDNPKIGVKMLKGLARLLSMNMRQTSSRLADFMLTMN